MIPFVIAFGTILFVFIGIGTGVYLSDVVNKGTRNINDKKDNQL